VKRYTEGALTARLDAARDALTASDQAGATFRNS